MKLDLNHILLLKSVCWMNNVRELVSYGGNIIQRSLWKNGPQHFSQMKAHSTLIMGRCNMLEEEWVSDMTKNVLLVRLIVWIAHCSIWGGLSKDSFSPLVDDPTFIVMFTENFLPNKEDISETKLIELEIKTMFIQFLVRFFQLTEMI